MDRQLATKISELSLEDVAGVLAKKAVLAKAAEPSLAEFSQLLANPVRQMTGGKTVPHVPMEVLRNALIGLGIGGVGTMASEALKPQSQRRRGRVIDNALLGGVLGAGGTLAYRHLGHSGDPANPARFQNSIDSITAEKSPEAKQLEEVMATPVSAAPGQPPKPAIPPEETFSGRVAREHTYLPTGVRRAFGRAAKGENSQIPIELASDISSRLDLANKPGEAVVRGIGAYYGTKGGWALSAGKHPPKTWTGRTAKTLQRGGVAGLGGAIGAYAPDILGAGYNWLTRQGAK